MRALGYAGIQSYIGCVNHLTVWSQSGKVINGQSGSPVTPANWKPYTIASSGNNTICNQTTTNSSAINFTIPGSTVYVCIADSTGAVTYTISIDGNSKGTFTAANSYSAAFMPDCRRFTDIGDSTHLVSISRTGGTGALTVIYVASNYTPVQAFGDGGNKTYWFEVGRMTAGTAGSSGYANYGGSDTAVASYNKWLSSAVYTLAADGLAVSMMPTNRYYDPKQTAQSDSLHPNNTGHTFLAQSIQNATSSYVMPQDRAVIDMAQKNIRWNQNGAGFSNSGGTYTPTATNNVNASGTITGAVSHWFRVADQIIVDGSFTCSSVTSANTTTSVLLVLPVATNITATTDLEGIDVLAGGTVSVTGACSGDASSDKAIVQWYPTGTGSAVIHFHFTYTLQL
jgi:hypothetical protein